MQLVPENRPDRNGKVVRKWVRPSAPTAASAAVIPVPAVAAQRPERRRRAFKPTESQLAECHWGIGLEARDEKNWGEHIIHEASPELQAVPYTEDQQRRAHGNWVRFPASEVEYFSVLSAAGPYDAINLLHRGIRSAEEAHEFLAEHGLEHLAQDNSAVCEEMLRLRVRANMALVYMQKILDYGEVDPRLAAEWVDLCGKSSILDKASVIRDEMLSGAVTAAELKAVGIRCVGHDPVTVTRAIIRWKEGGSTGYGLDDIRDIVEADMSIRKSLPGRTDPIRNTLEPALVVLHHHGPGGTYSRWSKGEPMYWFERTRMFERGGPVDERRLADLTVFAAELSYAVRDDVKDTLVRMFDTGLPAEGFRRALDGIEDRRMPMARRFELALETTTGGVHTAVGDGWL